MILNEIYKYKELLTATLYLFTDYDIEKEVESVDAELNSKDMEQFKDEYLDKNFEVDLSIEESFKMLINNTKHDLYKEVINKRSL